MTKKIKVGDRFIHGLEVLRVVAPYKVAGHWLAKPEDGPARVFSSGTIKLMRIKLAKK